jgi:hypothetical protein
VGVELQVGAMHASGRGGVMTGKPAAFAGGGERTWRQLAEHGYSVPVVAVEVRATGRMPVTVQRWSLGCSRPEEPRVRGLGAVYRRPRLLVSFTPLGLSMGQPLPHRLEAGASETWAVPLSEVQVFADVNKEVFKLSAAVITARVELGDGRTYWTRVDDAIRF